MLSYRAADAPRRLAENQLPPGPWLHTDDTEMAISIAEVLKWHGELDQDALAKRFARRFQRDPDRGYGSTTRRQLEEINAGRTWQDTAIHAFGGRGSMGNGGAMRVTPLGAYFANDLGACAAAACARRLLRIRILKALRELSPWLLRRPWLGSCEYEAGAGFAQKLFDEVLRFTPESELRQGILRARNTPADLPVQDVARALGNGSLATAPDTVPFCLWMAAHHPHDFVEAIGKTISVDGDCDTNAAIVGGIVALSTGRSGIPKGWLEAREVIAI